MRAGDIYLCDFGEPKGHEPGFIRPVLVFSSEKLNRYGTPFVIPITRTPRGYPSHVEIDGVLPSVSYAQCELLGAWSTGRFIKRLGSLDEVTFARVRQVVRRLLDL